MRLIFCVNVVVMLSGVVIVFVVLVVVRLVLVVLGCVVMLVMLIVDVGVCVVFVFGGSMFDMILSVFLSNGSSVGVFVVV